jgi:hypothetical protein
LLTPRQAADKVRALKAIKADRDGVHADLYQIRQGNIQDVFPSMFNDNFPKPVIANFIDVAARDAAETLAPLPTFNCSSANMVSDKARAFADKKTKGIQYYLLMSNMRQQMYTLADYYLTYGYAVFTVEPDFDTKVPRLVGIDSRGCYYEKNKYGRVTMFAKIYSRTIQELCAMFPDLADAIVGDEGTSAKGNNRLELVMYRDDDQIMMYLPNRADMMLSWARNPIGICNVVIAERPGVPQTPRGQYDDVIWIQVARNRFAMLAMEAAEQAVEAPLAVPFDVQEIPMGPNAALRTNSPDKIRKVGTEIPQAAFAEGQLLDAEMRNAARYPEVRQGNLNASIITGQGVKALEGGFDTQIRSAQDIFSVAFTDLIKLCLMTDEKLWPNHERSIRGQQEGVPFEVKWKPSRDIAGDYTVDVTYGFASGLDPNRSLVFILQMLGGGLISKDLARRQFPFDINVTQEEERIQVEQLRDALIQASAGYAQAVPILAQNGQDPGEVLGRFASMIQGIQKGQQIEDAVAKAFAPQTPPPGSAPESGAVPSGAPGEQPGGGGQGSQGLQPNGLPPGVAPGQASMGPGGSPTLMSMLAGLNSSGSPTTTVNVRRRQPARQ